MAHYAKVEYGKKPNFLASEVGLRLITVQVDDASIVEANADGKKIIPAGTILADKGIVFENVDVTNGEHEASLMVAGHFYKDKVLAWDDAYADSFTKQGLFAETSDAITRPEN